MTTANDVWEELGEMAEEDAVHVLARLFAVYEERQRHNTNDEAAAFFFRNLNTAISQASACNLNRR